MKKFLTLTFLAMIVSLASFALTSITGPTSCCVGSTIPLSDSLSPGGIWSSSNPAVATIGSSTGIVSGLSAGVVTITYTLGTYVTYTVTVSPGPTAIAGSTPVCSGSSITLSDATPGGTWSSPSGYYATVGSATGVVTGVHSGTVTIYYSIGTGCDASVTVTVTATATGYITGPTTVCAGSTITLTDSAGLSGTWSSGSPSIATVTGGVVTGVSGGTVVISYTTTGICGTAYATRTVTVSTTTSPGTITGATSVPLGTTATLYDGVTGGTWTSGTPAVGTIDATTGVVTGISLGITTITYSVTGCSGPASTSATVTVVSLDGISGHVLFSTPYSGLVKVYLITYNPSTFDLEAADSVSSYYTGSSFYYQFTGLTTDSFRIKGATDDSTGMTTGFIPTYHTNHFYWHDADVIWHTAGTSDINEDISMVIGTPTSGPGFIGGSVLTGANKGTSGGVPVVGMRMNIVNSATNQLLGAARTDATGSYTFSNLPVGQTYYVFPDSINYQTVPYTSVTLTTTTPTMSAASFIQHIVSHTITPISTGVKPIAPAVSSIIAYPNPTKGKLNIQWVETATENATITIADVTGRVIYNASVKMNEGSGVKQIDLSGFSNGLYVVSVNSGNINYNNKIQVQH